MFLSKCPNDNQIFIFNNQKFVSWKRKDVPNFRRDFAEISSDIENLIEVDNPHSTILRISPKNLEIWLHYDTLDNFLYQIHGKKEVLLFSPEDYENLYIEGDKSKINGFISDFER